MSDDANFSVNVNAGGDGFQKTQEQAAKFIGFMDRLNSKLKAVQEKSLDAASAIHTMGIASAVVKEQIELLAAGSTTLEEVQSVLGSTESQMNSQIRAILAGNESTIVSYEHLGAAWEKATIDADRLAVAMERVRAVQATTSARASEMRGQILGSTGEPIRGRVRSASVYESNDPMAYQDLESIAYHRAIAKIKKTAAKGGIGEDELKIPSIMMGDEKVRLNMARLQMYHDQLKEHVRDISSTRKLADKDELTAIKDKERAELDHYRLMRARLNEAVKAREQMHALERKQDLETERRHARFSNREMDQMYARMPDQTAKKYIGSAKGIWTRDLFNMRDWVGGEAKVGAIFKAMEKGTSLASKGFLALGRAVQGAGNAVAFMTSSVGGLLAMLGGAVIGLAAKSAIEFEHSMARIMTLVKDGEATLPELTEQVKRLSKEFGFSPMASAEGFRIAISSDVPPEEAMKFMEEAGKLSVAQNVSIEKSADMLAMMKNAFNLSTDSFSRLRDMIFVMTDRGRVEVDQFAGEIGKMAAVAKTAGVNVQEMLAVFAALSRTKGPEQAGTMAINLFKFISKQGPEAVKIMKALGIATGPEFVQGQGLLKQIEKIHDALQKNPGLIEKITDDFRELRAWGEITGSQFEALKSIMEDLTNRIGVGDEATKKMMETTEVKWNRLMAQLKISMIEFGESSMKTFNDWITSSGGVENAMRKMEMAFKRIELAVRLFIAPFEAVAMILIGAFEAVIDLIVALGNVWAMIFKGIGAGAMWIAEQYNKAMYEYTGDEEILKRQERVKKTFEGLADGAVESLAAAGKRAADAFTTDWVSAWNASGMDANRKSVQKLEQDIADLGQVTGEAADDQEQLAKFMALNGGNAKKAAQDLAKLKKAQEELNPKRDESAMLKRIFTDTITDQVKDGGKQLKQWLTDNRDTIKGIISGYRHLAEEQKSMVSKMKAQLKDLVKDQEKYDDAVEQTIQKIKDADRTPAEQVKQRIDRGQELEARANKAAKIGDRDEVQRLVQEASGIYESILNVEGANTKENRVKVIDALTRLRGEMDKVYGAEKIAIEDRMKTAEKAEKAFTTAANNVEAHFKSFEQGITDVGRALEELGKVPTDEKLKAIKEKIMKLEADSQFFINVQSDPALNALDKMIEKAKELRLELSAAPDELLLKLKDVDLKNLLMQGTPAITPSEPKSTQNNTSNTTNVDMRGTTINAGGDGGPKKADARKLARDIHRHIERGEAPALTRRK
jgi:TP901 family phage tail tape measure protein